MSVRQRKNKQKLSDEEIDLVGAQSWSDYWSNSDDKGRESRDWSNLGNISGKHGNPNLFEIFWNMFLELLGCIALAFVVTLVRGVTVSGNSVLNGFMIGLAYAATYYGIHQLPCQVSLRRHLNWGVSLAYLVVDEIGIPGWIMYACVQTLGGILGGFLISGLPILGTGDAIGPAVMAPFTNVTVPVPTTEITTFGYAFGMEFFGTFFIIFGLLAGEFWGTPTGDDRVLGNNYENGTRIASVLIVALVTALYSIQTYTFNHVVYAGGLFAGLGEAGIRDIANAASSSDQIYANTVMPMGSAWAFYFFVPGLAGLAAGLVYLFFAALRYKTPELTEKVRASMSRSRKSTDPDSTSVKGEAKGTYLQHVASSASQERVPLSSPYQKMKN